MSIKISDLLSEMEGLLDDEHKQYWEANDYRRHINQAVRLAFGWLYTANEAIFLEPATITVDATAVSTEQITFPLPARTLFVSHYDNQKYEGARGGFDFKPIFLGSAGDSCKLKPLEDYLVGLPNLIMSRAFQSEGTIALWVKKFPERVVDNTGEIALPEFFFDLLLEIGLHYARRKDRNPEKETSIVWAREQCLQMAKLQIGFPTAFKVDWDNLPDSGDL